jgi:hypothetical protein
VSTGSCPGGGAGGPGAAERLRRRRRTVHTTMSTPARIGRGPMSLRAVYLHLIQEYARHNGHADLLRQRIDGETG